MLPNLPSTLSLGSGFDCYWGLKPSNSSALPLAYNLNPLSSCLLLLLLGIRSHYVVKSGLESLLFPVGPQWPSLLQPPESEDCKYVPSQSAPRVLKNRSHYIVLVHL